MSEAWNTSARAKGSPSHHRPLVSVVVPFFNAGHFLNEAIESVLGQTYEHWELLLINDGSTDNSSRTARSAASRMPEKVRYLQHSNGANRGTCASRNVGIRHARGQLIAPLDADDVWLPNKLEEQVTILQRHPEAGMVYGLAQYWHSWDGDNYQHDHSPRNVAFLGHTVAPPALAVASYPFGTAITPCPSDLMIRADTLEQIGGFEEAFTGARQLYEDQAFLAKAFFSTTVHVADRTWILYRQHDASCVARVSVSDERDEAWRFFINWYDDYLRQVKHVPARIRWALAREKWLAERPRLRQAHDRLRHGLRRLLRRSRERVAAAASAVGSPGMGSRPPEQASQDQ